MPPDPAGLNENRYKWKALLTVALGAAMATMDASIINIAFPVLTRVFEADLTVVVWVTIGFILISTSSMLIIGKISDVIGRKRIYAMGMAVFTLGLLACSMARSVEQLILFRCFQALGAAMSVSTSTAIVTEAFPHNEVGRGLGFLGMSVSVGFIIGPILGGFLLDWLDWRSIFYVRAPIGFVGFALALFLLKKDRPRTRDIQPDLAGTLTSSGGIFLFAFGVSRIREYGLSSPGVYGIVGMGLACLLLFVWVETRARNPIVDLTLFQNPVFSRNIWAYFLVFVAAPPFILIMPFYLIQGHGFSPSKAGMLMAVTSVVTLGAGPLSGTLSDRFKTFKFAALGAGVIGSAYGIMLSFDLHTPVPMVASVLVLLGMGIGSFHPPNNSLIMSSVDKDHLGTASALIATYRQVGILVGMAVTSTLFSARAALHQEVFLSRGLPQAGARSLAIPPAFHEVLYLGIALQALAFLLSVTGGKRSGVGGQETPTPE
ncbi:MAG: MFS transporter [Desulfobacteraceae bacterium]